MDGREYAVKKVLIRSYVDADGHLSAKFSQKFMKVLREVKILNLLDHANVGPCDTTLPGQKLGMGRILITW